MVVLMLSYLFELLTILEEHILLAMIFKLYFTLLLNGIDY